MKRFCFLSLFLFFISLSAENSPWKVSAEIPLSFSFSVAGRISAEELPDNGRKTLSLKVLHSGVEKGNNSFALTARGDAGTLLTLELTLLQRDNRTRREKREFRLKKDWQTFLLPVSVSPETAVLHCSISQTGGAQPVEVRDLSFAKSNP